jgi:hypothetical protein
VAIKLKVGDHVRLILPPADDEAWSVAVDDLMGAWKIERFTKQSGHEILVLVRPFPQKFRNDLHWPRARVESLVPAVDALGRLAEDE